MDNITPQLQYQMEVEEMKTKRNIASLWAVLATLYAISTTLVLLYVLAVL